LLPQGSIHLGSQQVSSSNAQSINTNKPQLQQPINTSYQSKGQFNGMRLDIIPEQPHDNEIDKANRLSGRPFSPE